jgi:hypothetical protein
MAGIKPPSAPALSNCLQRRQYLNTGSARIPAQPALKAWHLSSQQSRDPVDGETLVRLGVNGQLAQGDLAATSRVVLENHDLNPGFAFGLLWRRHTAA